MYRERIARMCRDGPHNDIAMNIAMDIAMDPIFTGFTLAVFTVFTWSLFTEHRWDRLPSIYRLTEHWQDY
jgi:hypothetical protein